MRTSKTRKLACKFRDERLTAYIFIYLFKFNHEETNAAVSLLMELAL